MPNIFDALHVFNRGRISVLGLARTDLQRTKLSAEVMTNWIPRSLGSMSLRPGLEYIGQVDTSSTTVIYPFVFSSTFAGILELTGNKLQVWVNDTKISRDPSTATITNGDFSSSSLTGWTDSDESGSTSYWSGSKLFLVGNNYTRAKRRQAVSASSGTHGLAVDVEFGRLTLRVGSSAGGDDYFEERELRPGIYSLGITSTGTFHVELSAATEYITAVNEVSVESSGAMSISTPWGSDQVRDVRFDQSGDVVFASMNASKSRRIERYSSDSWSVAEYDPLTGPFRNPEPTLTRLNVDGLSGNVNLYSDRDFFRSGHVGALFRLTAPGQNVSLTVSGADQYTNPIRVAGITDERIFSIIIESTGYSGTVRVQRSVGSSADFEDVTSLFYTSGVTNLSTDFDDNADNQIIYYRIGMGAGEYSSGSPKLSLSYSGGGITGIGQVTSVVGATQVAVNAVVPFGSTATTELWQEGEWSDYRGYPSAVAFHEGRLWWAGKAKVWGSVSDEFENFDLNFFGDAGPISRNITAGGVENVNWIGSLGRLIIGTPVKELNAKTNSLEEPLTPANFNLRDISSQGSRAAINLKLDNSIYFIQRGGSRLMETVLAQNGFEYKTEDKSVLVPEIGSPSFVRLGAQRKPDTRIHGIRTDGTVGMLVHEPAESVLAWCDIESSGGVNGEIEDTAILPGEDEDSVYYVVKREINGSTVRYLEKWATENQNKGGSSNRMADSFVVQEGAPTVTVTGLDHLIGANVVAYGTSSTLDIDLGSYTVSTGGTITLTQDSSHVVVGLPYSGVFRSVKMDYEFARLGILTGLTRKKKINHLGVILAHTHTRGLKYGPSTDVLDPLPLIENGAPVDTKAVNRTYDQESFEFPGEWNSDSRLVLVADAPKPATVVGAVIDIEQN